MKQSHPNAAFNAALGKIDAMNTPGGGSFFDVPTFSATIPKEGPKFLPIALPFTAVDQKFNLNLLLTQAQQFMSCVQSAFIDNSNNSEPLSINISLTNQTLVIPANSQAYLPVPVPKNGVVTAASAVAADTNVALFLCNVPLPAAVWPTTGWGGGGGGSSASTFTPGQVSVDATATQIITAGGLGAIVTNTDASNTLYVGPDDTVTDATGFPIGPGASLNLDDYSGAVWGITSGATLTAGGVSFAP